MSFQFVQGRTNNRLTWVGVDSTDFASRESALSSTWKIKIWGGLETQTGLNFITSGTGSLTNDVVHVGASATGVYTIALAKADLSDASAAWYDEYVVIFSPAGASYETFIVEGVRTDTSYVSNVLSNLSAIVSDIFSALTGGTFIIGTSNASDIASAVWAHATGTRVDSRVLLNQSRISDTYSMLSDFLSDFQSRVPKLVATNSQVSDLVSDLRSYLVVMSGVGSDTYSMLSDFLSDFQSRVPKRVATDSQLSDVLSDLRSFVGAGVLLTTSAMSDIASQVWAHTVGTRVDSRLLLVQSAASDAASGVSDLRRLLVTTGVALTASAMSDIASQVWAHAVGTRVDSRLLLTQSMASDAASAAQQVNSRVLLNLSRISDVYSLLSDTQSDLLSLLTTTGIQLNASTMSDLRSAITGGAAGTLSVSDISDIASAVRAILVSDLSDILSAAQQANSRVLLNLSRISDTYSMLSDFYSDFQSRVPKPVATNSQVSDLLSDLRSFVGAGVGLEASTMSDLRSAITAGAAGTLTVSDISDIASAVRAILVSDLSDILSAAVQTNSRVLLNLSRISDVYSLLSDTQSDLLSLLTTTGVQL